MWLVLRWGLQTNPNLADRLAFVVDDQTVRAGNTGIGTGGKTTNTTPGATTRGGSSPRK